MNISRFIQFTLILLITAVTAGAAVLVVPDDYASMQDAIDAASDNDTIMVRDGSLPDYFYIDGKSLYLRSENGPDMCSIGGFSVTGTDNFAEFDGFTVPIVEIDEPWYCNIGNPSARLHNCVFEGGLPDSTGALSIDSGSAVTIENCRFEDLQAVEAAAIFANEYTQLTIAASDFANCKAFWDGAIRVKDNSTVSLIDSRFLGNEAYRNAAIEIHRPEKIEIDGCRFEGNNCIISGAPVVIDWADSVLINETEFISNSCDEETGALSITFYNHVSILNSRFIDNSRRRGALGLGGAVVLQGGSIGEDSVAVGDVTVSGSYFEGNIIKQIVFSWTWGAALCIYAPNIEVTDCEFYGNKFLEDGQFFGGALGLNYQTATVTGCVFAGNKASYGSAIHLYGATANLSNLTIFDNQAGPEGGAIDYFNNQTATISNCVMASNSGAIWFNPDNAEPELTIECTDIYGNTEGDWTGDIASFADINGNFSLAPIFCNPENSVFAPAASSPLLPENNSCGELIGALDLGCDVICGVVNADGRVNVLDIIYLMTYKYLEGPAPLYPEAGDVDADGSITIMDITILIDYIFKDGEPLNCP